MPGETLQKVDSPEQAKAIIERFDRLKAKREGFYSPAWRAAASWMQPRKASIWGHSEKTPGETGWIDNLFDMTAMSANEKLAAWLMTNTSPANSRWFIFGPSAKQRARWRGVVCIVLWTALFLALADVAINVLFSYRPDASGTRCCARRTCAS